MNFLTAFTANWTRMLNQWTRSYAMSFRRRDGCLAKRERCLAKADEKRAQRRATERRVEENRVQAALQRRRELNNALAERKYSECQLARAAFEARMRMNDGQESAL